MALCPETVPKGLRFEQVGVNGQNGSPTSVKLQFKTQSQKNLVIKGDNLAVLKLLKKKYHGKIKLIYIDPPYNSGNSNFAYRDRYRHSSWLKFMRHRLEVARELLSEDGSIYVQLDSNEVHYCKVLMDEIFGRACFQREIIWRIGWVSGFKTITRNWVRNHDTILFYTKRKGKPFFNKPYIPYPKDYRRRNGGGSKGRGYALEDTWNCSPLDRLDSIQIKSFDREKTGFLTQKNEALLQRIIEASSSPGDLVLDFFAGSGTTGAVAHKLKRRYIMVDESADQIRAIRRRLRSVIAGEPHGISKKVQWKGGGSFAYEEL